MVLIIEMHWLSFVNHKSIEQFLQAPSGHGEDEHAPRFGIIVPPYVNP